MGNQHVLDQSSYKEKGDASKGIQNFQKLAQELVDSITTMAACTVLISHGFFFMIFIYIIVCTFASVYLKAALVETPTQKYKEPSYLVTCHWDIYCLL